jgi:sugar phosphate isomerase/epimerase
MLPAALSTGCFVGHEQRLTEADLQLVELASHRESDLPVVLRALADRSTRIVGIHAPCPNRGASLDLAARGDRRGPVVEALHEAMGLADLVGADYVVVHAFYCFDGELPSDDIERMAVLRQAASAPDVGIAEYRRSPRYREAQRRATENLRALLPELQRDHPGRTLLLENLNPRVGYGGIWLDDVTQMARELGGRVGVCLDVGHLALSAAVLGLDMAETVRSARRLIRTLHVHQNFGGRYFVDRRWDETVPRTDLQELDVHLPLLASCTPVDSSAPVVVTPDNRAFAGILTGAVRYVGLGPAGQGVDDPPTGPAAALHDARRSPAGAALRGLVPIARLVRLVDASVRPVLELDSRYAPLDDILLEHRLAHRGEHPVLR